MDFARIPKPVFCFDQVILLSSATKRRLNAILPIKALREYYPRFRVRAFNHATYQSKVCFIPISRPLLELLQEHENKLGFYDINSIELAYDFPASSIEEAKEIYRLLSQSIDKKYHRRGSLFICNEDTAAPKGIIKGSTSYWENKDAATGLKLYCRYDKKTNQPMCRLEWTLSGVSGIYKKTGIGTLKDLITFNGDDFLRSNLRISTINKSEFINYFFPKSKNKNRAFCLYTRINAHKNPLSNSDFESALNTERSVSQLKGHLLTEKKQLQKRKGRRNHWQKKVANLTQYQLNKIFRRVNIIEYWRD